MDGLYADWIRGLIGGLMIGCAAAVYLLGNGKVMGASGIIAGLLGDSRAAWIERAVFFAALVAVPGAIALAQGGRDTHVTHSVPLLVAGGLLVGFGTRMGNGCTSGHGVCGMSRLSLRGIVASGVYVVVGMVVFTVLRMLGVLS